MVYGPGRYRFADFFRVGGLLSAVVFVLAMTRRELGWRALQRALPLGIAALFLLLVLVAVKPDLLGPALARARAFDLSGRAKLWQAAWELACERPVLGWGLGSFNALYDLRHPPGSVAPRGGRVVGAPRLRVTQATAPASAASIASSKCSRTRFAPRRAGSWAPGLRRAPGAPRRRGGTALRCTRRA